MREKRVIYMQESRITAWTHAGGDCNVRYNRHNVVPHANVPSTHSDGSADKAQHLDGIQTHLYYVIYQRQQRRQRKGQTK